MRSTIQSVRYSDVYLIPAPKLFPGSKRIYDFGARLEDGCEGDIAQDDEKKHMSSMLAKKRSPFTNVYDDLHLNKIMHDDHVRFRYQRIVSLSPNEAHAAM